MKLGGDMKKLLFPVLVVFTLLTGCASSSHKVADLDSRLGALDSRVASVEQKQDARDTRSEDAYSSSKSYRVREEVAPVKKSSTKSAKNTKVSARKKEIQTALKSAGYYNGKIDGKIGPRTKKAIKEFQAAKGLKADGVVGSATRKALREYGLSN